MKKYRATIGVLVVLLVWSVVVPAGAGSPVSGAVAILEAQVADNTARISALEAASSTTTTATPTTTTTVPPPTTTTSTTTTAPPTTTTTVPPTTTTTTVSPPSPFPGLPAVGTMYWGAAVGGNSDPTSRHEEPTGAPLPIRRTFFQWHHRNGTWMPNLISNDLATGRLPWVSIKTPRWDEMAAGDHDADIDAFLTWLDAMDGPVWLTMWHEPENDLAAGRQPADHVAMNQRVRARMDALGVDNVALALILMGWTWDDRSGRNPSDWYAPSLYDILGSDPYSLTDGFAFHQNPSLAESWTDYIDWVNARDGVCAIGEWGLIGGNEQVHDWYDELLAQGCVAAVAFDSGLNSSSPTGTWELDANGQMEAFHELLVDPRTARL